MSPGDMPALLQALELLEAPRSRRPSPNESLPHGVLLLLRIVAADKQALATASEVTGASSQRVREAAGFYIEQVLFAPGSDPYRVLGVDSNAPDEQVKEHHRWLLRWLHPDRNPDEWEAVFAERVNQAWQKLRTPDRRIELDRRLGETFAGDESHAPGFPVRAAAKVDASPMAPVVTSLRWLSNLVFAGLAVSAVAALGVLYALHVAESRNAPAEVARESAPSIEPELEPVPVAMPAPATLSEPLPVAVQPASPIPQPKAKAYRPVAVVPKRVATPARATERIEKPRAAPPVRLASASAIRPAQPVAARATTTYAASAMSATDSSRVIATPASESGASFSSGRSALDDRAANEMLALFAQIYRDGDLGRLEDLLTADAKSARSGRKGIVSEYARLFSSSERRSLNVSNVSWVGQADSATIIASFEASIWQRRSGAPRRLHGDLRLDLRMDQGRWRIFRLMHEERRG